MKYKWLIIYGSAYDELMKKFFAPKTLNYLAFNLSILSVPDEGYYRNVPDEGYYRNVPDEGYSRNALCALHLISTFLLVLN